MQIVQKGKGFYFRILDLRLHITPGNIYKKSNFSSHYNIYGWFMYTYTYIYRYRYYVWIGK